MDTKTIIAFVLFILIYMYFFQPKPVPQQAQQQVVTNTVQASPEKTSPASKAVIQKPAVDTELEARIFTLKNKDFEVEINGLSRILSARFLKYYLSLKDQTLKSVKFEEGYFDDISLSTSSGAPQWKVKESSDNRIVFESLKESSVTRTIEIPDYGYFLRFKDEIENKTSSTTTANFELAIRSEVFTKKPHASFIQRIIHPDQDTHEALYWLDNSLKRAPYEKIEANQEVLGQINFGGFSEKYFYYGAFFQNFSATKTLYNRASEDNGPIQKFGTAEKSISPNEKTTYEYGFYLGPKEIRQLEAAAIEMREVVDYGSWLGPIARLLLAILHFFHSIIANYGVGIILLTILVKTVLFPLAFKSAVSMRKLQLVQPKMKDIKERYKNDKQKMQIEMMNLYKTEKVNPVGGCLPMLLQMPVFFALYRVFYLSIDFRHAPFFGWIKDLSAYDPLFITPVLLTGLMWYQTRVTPQPPAMEENEAVQVQRAMMKWMPILFGAISVFLPSGLNIYLVVNVIISIIQQVYLNKYLERHYPLAISGVKAKA